MDKPVFTKLTSAMPWGVATRIIAALLGIPISIIVVRFLGEYNYGIYSILRIILGFLTIILGFGLGQAILRYLPEFNVKHQYDNIRVLILRTLMMHVFLWVLALFIFFLAGDVLDVWFRTHLKAYLWAGISISLLTIVFTTLNQVLTSVYETKFIALNQLARNCLLLILTFWFLKIGLGIYGVFIAAGLCNLFIIISFISKLLKLFKPKFKSSISMTLEFFDQKRILKYSLPTMSVGLLSLVVWRQSEILLLGYFFSPLEAGYFNLGYQLPQQILEFIPLAIWPLILASFSEIYSKKHENLVPAVKIYYKFLFSITVPIATIGILLGDKAIIILYGENMAKAGLICQAFFFIFSICFIETPLSMALFVKEKTWINLIFVLSQATLNIALDLLIIPRFGLYGAIFPVAIVLTLSPYFRYLVVKRLINDVEIPWKFIGKCYLTSLPLLLLLPLRSFANGSLSFLVILFIAIFILTVSIRHSEIIEKDDLEIIRISNIPMKDFLMKLFIKKNKNMPQPYSVNK
ncbi:MAG: oligosaccharide flippase family protein [Candidatus Hodarchaeota archaeon]